ncbi:MAG: 2-oxo acid dehydrogenase subunit E2 [Bdellovibrionales bacterium]|nr:2-oxo acid dehydrogenase subunit E2 [Bdellovibrionales bacterium]
MSKEQVLLPDLGEGVEEGELVQWLVKIGDSVVEDQTIAEVMTDKATMEVPTAIAGVVTSLNAKEGDILHVGSLMIELKSSKSNSSKSNTSKSKNFDDDKSQAVKNNTSQAVKNNEKKPITEKPSLHSAIKSKNTSGIFPPPVAGHVLAAPSTRKLARDNNIDLNKVVGSGLSGKITRDDVINFSNSGGSQGSESKTSFAITDLPKAAGPEERIPLRGIRRKISEQMQKTKHIVPHFTLMDQVVVDSLVDLREKLKQETLKKHKIKVTYLPFVIKALIKSLKKFPEFNASIDDKNSEIVYKKYFNIAFAADTPQGLLVPVIKDADKKDIVELSKEIVLLATKARDGKLTRSEMSGASMTITNIGSVGGTYATPIINHPEVAILGMYKMTDQPKWENNSWGREKVMNYTITCDHRLIDGAKAAQFLKFFLEKISQPSSLL